MTKKEEKAMDQKYRDTLLCSTVKHQSMMMSAMGMLAARLDIHDVAVSLEMQAANAEHLWKGFADRFDIVATKSPTAEELLESFFSDLFGEDIEVDLIDTQDGEEEGRAEPDPDAKEPAYGLVGQTIKARHW